MKIEAISTLDPAELTALTARLQKAPLNGAWPADLEQGVDALSPDDIYRLQFSLMKALEENGDRVIGYKAAFTSLEMQKRFQATEPAIGTLLASGLLPEGAPIEIGPDAVVSVEPEIAVLLGSDLVGPGLASFDVQRATAGIYAAAEIVTTQPSRKQSRKMGSALSKTTGGIILGARLNPLNGMDLITEGVVLLKNGTSVGSATGVEALGNPLDVVAFIANRLSVLGLGLRAGMLILTGSLVPILPVARGDSIAIKFTRLGNLNFRFV